MQRPLNNVIMEKIIVGLIVAVSSSLINFIATKVYGYITGKSKSFFWKNRYKPITDYKSNLNLDELKKITRIVVIDDDPIFPLQLFVDAGYFIEKWDKVKDYSKLESGFYDIIILDIIGIAEHISKDDGMGVLESIKRTNPSQIIVAFSSHSFDFSKQKFWELADEKIAKPIDFLRIKEVVDNLLLNIFNPQRYFRQIRYVLEKNNIPQKDINMIESKILSCIAKKKFSDCNDIFNPIRENKLLLKQSDSLLITIQKFYK